MEKEVVQVAHDMDQAVEGDEWSLQVQKGIRTSEASRRVAADEADGGLDRCFEAARHHRGKLYGRDQEIERMRDAYLRVKNAERREVSSPSSLSLSELILINGSTGIGKSGLAQSIRSEVEQVDGGYFLCAKFDQMQRPEPHYAFVGAFTEFAMRAVDRGDAPYFREALIKQGMAFESGGKVLVEIIPALSVLLEFKGEQDTATIEEPTSFRNGTMMLRDGFENHSTDEELKSSNNKRPISIDSVYSGGVATRFQDALRIFVRAAATPMKPLVLLLEDLHWADECSLEVIQTLLDDRTSRGVLFIATYRGDMEVPAERLSLALQNIRKTDVRFTRLALSSLTEPDINILLAEVLHVDYEQAIPLTSLISNRTRGNVFFIWEYLRVLRDRRLLSVDDSSGCCHWEMEDIGIEVNSVNELLRTKIEELPTMAQENLKIAACLGSKLDESILRRLMSLDETAFSAFVHEVAAKGLISFECSDGSSCFSHDGIQETTYGLIPLSERQTYHYRIGRKLWRMFDLNELENFIFLVVGQLTIASDRMDDDKERIAVAKLCLSAGVRAVQLSNFQASISYLERGISLLGRSAWHDEYDLCLDLYNAAAEVANSLGQFERVYELVAEVLAHAHVFHDTLRGHATMVHALGSSGRYADALKSAFQVLEALGEPFPSKPSLLRTYFEFVALRRRLRAKSDESLLRLPMMADKEKLAAMQMLNLVILSALMTNFEMAPLIGFRMVRLTLDYGLSAVSCIGFVLFAGITCGIGNDIDEGYRIGKLSFSLYEKFDTKAWLARLSAIYFDFVHGWVRPFGDCREPLKQAYQAGLESGDIEFALACAVISWGSRLEIDKLPELTQEMDWLTERMELCNQRTGILLTKPQRQLMQNLMGLGDGDPVDLKGAILDDAGMLEIKAIPQLYLGTHIHHLMLNFLFGRYSEAAKYAKAGRELATPAFGPVYGGYIVFVCGLAAVADARRKKRRRSPYTKKCSKILRRAAAKGEPLNFLGKHYLLEAELAALSGNAADALTLYASAISTSREGKFMMQTAMANERTARFLLEQGDHERSRTFFREALVGYGDWGASAKVDHLENEIRELGFE